MRVRSDRLCFLLRGGCGIFVSSSPRVNEGSPPPPPPSELSSWSLFGAGFYKRGRACVGLGSLPSNYRHLLSSLHLCGGRVCCVFLGGKTVSPSTLTFLRRLFTLFNVLLVSSITSFVLSYSGCVVSRRWVLVHVSCCLELNPPEC